ncbi:pyridoxal-phosphate dependent enzyme [Legionella longbeachae]|uniref:Putative 1-aminocyclopropane-1-carboxylate deaminase n=1 Tax=Legionella longbeachae serogroup 1 (strain NSW150) TaxID=661367 RepID=D3HSD1_LEGLN|nr:pyridoxal-phosphate dependent enzyme [Legionella longbeachae]VEE02315.1 1-aminocyclopropane-1-carboxylate deaminase [Legionella oakridgensis]HBD7398193.1 pyridoxal-phosphate dependent enzyme [Legionella pneumophila]ARB91397.1 1-aminocyclopropane-1-carboxylate deaminase [Legionella longbeachae]ARM32176.1 pyridoxal-phosphate dependent enzyme [Legionella longbeachae]EEZ95044.1 putative 1-aminocyclopropane-1-carboxylate deaminase [Legionella longbeachae D-4968]
MWNLSSRVHLLNHFPEDGVVCYVKRDDELSCGISGSKLRKYASLFPFLIEQKIRHLIIIAGPQSNNLLSVLQLAREFQFKVTAFLIQPWKLELQGNYKLSRLFLEEEDIVWVSRDSWTQVNELAINYLKTLNEPGFVLFEGASVSEAMPGAATLAEDIIFNERTLKLIFQHIFIDAGTGFSASALISRLAELNHQAQIHVLLLADDEELFYSKLNQWIGLIPKNFNCFYPTTAKAFGSVNQTIKNEVLRLAKEEGILADPIYAAKLFYESRKRIQIKRLKGNVLIIHSGGTLSMPAFDYI